MQQTGRKSTSSRSLVGDKLKETILTAPGKPNHFIEHLPVAIEDNNRGEALDVEFLGELLVVFLQLFRLFYVPREVSINKDQGGICYRPEFLGIKNFLLQLDTGWAPIGSMKLHQDKLSFILSLGEGVVIIRQPALFGRMRGRHAHEQACNKGHNR